MARLASKSKLGFYPTPPVVCDAVVRLLSAASRDALFRLLDPCVGDGKALARIRQRLQEQHAQRHGRYADFSVSTWGIEPDAVRAQQAERLLDHVIQSNFFK